MRLAILLLPGAFAFRTVNIRPACAPAVVESLSTHKLVDHLFTECIVMPGTGGLTLTGNSDPGSSGCLTMFLLANGLVVPNGACRESVQEFVSGMITTVLASPEALSDIYLDEDDKLVFDDYYPANIQDDFEKFHQSNGLSILFPACTERNIRDMDEIGLTDNMIKYFSGGPTLNDWYYSRQVGFHCGWCYDTFFLVLSYGGLNSNQILKTVCLADPRDPLCVNSTILQRAQLYFRTCAGHDVHATPRICPKVADQARLYKVMMHCKFGGNCGEFDVVGSDNCGDCFNEFFSNINTTDDAVVACETIDSDICIAFQQKAFIRFMACFGSHLDLRE
jgi:hypothetical protein